MRMCVRRRTRAAAEMSVTIDVGDASTATSMVMVAVNTAAGDTVTIANSANSPGALNVYSNGIDAAASTVAAGANTSVTTPTFIQSSSGVCSVKLTGGQYGS